MTPHRSALISALMPDDESFKQPCAAPAPSAIGECDKHLSDLDDDELNAMVLSDAEEVAQKTAKWEAEHGAFMIEETRKRRKQVDAEYRAAQQTKRGRGYAAKYAESQAQEASLAVASINMPRNSKKGPSFSP